MACAAPLPILDGDGSATSDGSEAPRLSRLDTAKFMTKSLPKFGTVARPWRVLEAERQQSIFTPYHHHLPEEHLILFIEFVKDLNASPGLTFGWPGEGDMRGLADCLCHSLNYLRQLVAQSLRPGSTKGSATHLLGNITSLDISIASLVKASANTGNKPSAPPPNALPPPKGGRGQWKRNRPQNPKRNLPIARLVGPACLFVGGVQTALGGPLGCGGGRGGQVMFP